MKTLRINTLATALTLVVVMTTMARAEPMRSSFECLPANTVMAVRVPSMDETGELFRTNTNFGRVMFSQDRWDALIEFIQHEEPDDWAEFEEALGKVGLEFEDFHSLLAGEVGYGLTGELGEDKQSALICGFLWTTPGAEKAEKFVAAMMQALEDNADDSDMPTRTDLEIAGHDVIHLATDDEPIDIFLVTMGDRLVMMHTVNLTDDEDDARDVWAGTDRSAATLARFIVAHEDGPEGESFASRILATPGMAAAMPEGHTVLEFYADVRPVMQMLNNGLAQDEDSYDYEEQLQMLQVFKALGLDNMGTIGLKITLDGQITRSGFFIEAPAPRQGLMKLMDQPVVQPGVPAWVPADVVDYGHMSFDAGEAWQLARQMIIDIGGEQAQNFLDQMVEMNVMAFAQSDLTTILTAMGNRVHVLTYPPTADPTGIGEIRPDQQNRMAVIWKLSDETVWQQVMLGATGAAMMSNGMVVPAEEQGFTGLRIGPMVEMDGALMLGKGYLVLGFGENVTTPVLSALTNPPADEGALVNSEAYQQFNTLFDAKPGVTYQYTDTRRYMGMLYDVFKMGFDQGVAGVPDSERESIDRLRELMPTRKELMDSFGPAGGHSYVNEHGMVAESIMYMPNDQ